MSAELRPNRILTKADVAALLTLDDCIAAVEDVFRRFGEGRVEAPRSLGIHGLNGGFHIKVAMTDIFAAKVNANFPDNPRLHGLPTVQGVIVVLDLQRGTPLGILDSTEITTLRTAAATAVAARHLAREDAATVTIIGCGVQGRVQLEALTRVRPVRRAFACDVHPALAARFATEMKQRLTIDVSSSLSIEEAVAQSDMVVTCTPAREPILDVQHLHDGLFIAAVGADHPEKQELTPALLARARVVPDFIEQAAVMGDLHHAIVAGLLSADEVHGELGEVLSGRAAERTDDKEIFVFDSTGTALQDVAVAAIVLQRAAERDIGSKIALA